MRSQRAIRGRGPLVASSLAALVVAGGWLACSYSPNIESGTLHCSQEGACPDGFACVVNYCVKPSDGGLGGMTGAGGRATGGNAATGGGIVPGTGGIGTGGKATGGAAAGTGGAAMGGSGTGGQRTGGTGTGGVATGGAATGGAGTGGVPPATGGARTGGANGTGGAGTGGAGTGGAGSGGANPYAKYVGTWTFGSDATYSEGTLIRSLAGAMMGISRNGAAASPALFGQDICKATPLDVDPSSGFLYVADLSFFCRDTSVTSYTFDYYPKTYDLETLDGLTGTFFAHYQVIQSYLGTPILTDDGYVEGSVTKTSATPPAN